MKTRITAFMLVGFLLLGAIPYSAHQRQMRERKENRKNKTLNFQLKTMTEGKGGVRWNEITGTPASIQGLRIKKYKGTPEEIAKAFFEEEK